MEESEELKKQVITNLRACLISSQGGIPANSLNNDYRQLLGEYIPFKKLGHNSLESFLRSVPEINLKNVNGTILVEAKKTACSTHITNLVEKQRKTGRKRSKKSQQIKRLSRPKANKPLTIPPRFTRGGNKARGPPPLMNEATKPAPRGNVDSHAHLPNRNYKTSAPSSNSNVPRPPPLLPTPLQHYLPTPHGSYINQHMMPHPRAAQQPHYVNPSLIQQSQEPPVLYHPQPLLSVVPQLHRMPSFLKKYNPSQVIKQQTVELCQQFQQQLPPMKTSAKTKSKSAHKRKQALSKIKLVKNDINSNKMTIFEHIPLPSQMSKDSYYNKLLDFVKNREWPEPEVCLLRQKGGIVTCIVSVKCSKPGQPSDMSVGVQEFTTYPDEITDAIKALEQGTKKAYDTIVQITSENYPVTKDTKLMLDRLAEMVKEKANGIWAFQIERDYVDKFKEGLPPRWIEIVKNSNVLCASDLGHSYVLKPYMDEDNEKMISPCQKGHFNFTIPQLIPPETDQWDVYVSRAHSFSEVWIRLIGENYSKQLENLTTEIELYYFDDKNPPVTKVEVDKYYVAICDNSAFRIIIKECYGNEALVHFVDHGDDEILPLDVIKELIPKFYTLPSQAILVNLYGLDCISKVEYRDDIMDNIVGNSYIALVEKRQPYSLVLFDTSENKDVDINKMLIKNVLEDFIHQPMVLKVGTVKEVRVCHIDNNGQVFIQIASTPALDILHERLEAIERGECEINKVLKINFNKVYLIKHMGEIQRVIVNPTNHFSKQNVDVTFIDEGNTKTVNASELFEVTDDYDVLNIIPNQALKIYLKDIQPFKLTDKKIKKLREIAAPTRPIISKVVEITDLPVLELFIRNQTDKLLASVNHSIELEDILESSNGDSNLEKPFENLRISDIAPKNVEPVYSPTIPTTIMPTQLDEKDIYKWDCDGDFFAAHRAEIPSIGERYFEIYVADAASPTNFTVQPLKFLPNLNKLTKEMKQFYDHIKPSVITPFQYDVYAVKHSDGFWYRAVVHRIFNDNVTVKLCDYGHLDVVSLIQLRPLHKKFMVLPFLGIKATLAGIAPKHKDWSVDDCIKIKQMIKGKKLISVIKEALHSKDEMILNLEITDTTSNTDINISHQLVLEGRAIYM